MPPQLLLPEKGGRWTRGATQQDKGNQQFISALCKDLSSQRWQTKRRAVEVPISAAAAAIWLRGIAGHPARVGMKPSSSNREPEILTLLFSFPSS